MRAVMDRTRWPRPVRTPAQSPVWFPARLPVRDACRLAARIPLRLRRRRAAAITLALLAPVLLAPLAPAPARAGGVRFAGPVLAVEPATIDFGPLEQESVQRALITLRNEGSETLTIHKIDSDCGCTVAQLRDSTLAPGDTANLRVSLTTRHFSGAIAKHVTLETNDPGAPKSVITLKAFVRVTVRLDPQEIDFGAVSRGQTPAATITIKALAAEKMEVTEVLVPRETFAHEVASAVEGDSLVYRVTLRLRPDAPVGVFKEKALVRTSHKMAREMQVTLTGQVFSFFRIEPPDVRLGQVRQGVERRASVRLDGTGAARHRVIAASCSHAGLRTEIQTLEEGRSYEVTVVVPADAPPERIDATLRLQTDDPAQPVIQIPVRGNIRVARSK